MFTKDTVPFDGIVSFKGKELYKMIEVSNLTKKYGNHTALDSVSFKVEKGHIYGLLGPNGAGKSTTMNILTGYIAPSEGSVIINGFDMGLKPHKAKACIGYLPEIPPLYPDMNVYEYLYFASSIKKVPASKRKDEVARVMALTNIDTVQKRLIKNLSKGFKQRVGIAQALLGEPEIIILDEPTVGLDPEQIIEIRSLISNLKEKHTVILSSHILSEISAVCDEVLMIAKGKVVALDTTDNILKMSKKSQKLELLLKGTKEQIEEVFAKLFLIESYTFIEEADGRCKFEIIAVESKEDIREELSFALFDAKILILEMRSTLASLEDIYLEILQSCVDEKDEISENDDEISVEEMSSDSSDFESENDNPVDEKEEA